MSSRMDLIKCDTQKNTVSVSAGKKRKNGRRDDNFGPSKKKQRIHDNNNTNSITSSSSTFDTVCDVFYVYDLMFC